jgi:mono/diheme cytochrome c family protein
MLGIVPRSLCAGLFFLAAFIVRADSPAHSGHDHHWRAPEQAATRRNPVSDSASSIARGGKLFQTHCASCHGRGGRGDGPASRRLDPKPADLKAMAGHHSDGDLAWKIGNGRGAMPAWKGVLTEREIWHLVNYIKNLPAGKKAKTAHEHRH